MSIQNKLLTEVLSKRFPNLDKYLLTDEMEMTRFFKSKLVLILQLWPIIISLLLFFANLLLDIFSNLFIGFFVLFYSSLILILLYTLDTSNKYRKKYSLNSIETKCIQFSSIVVFRTQLFTFFFIFSSYYFFNTLFLGFSLDFAFLGIIYFLLILFVIGWSGNFQRYYQTYDLTHDLSGIIDVENIYDSFIVLPSRLTYRFSYFKQMTRKGTKKILLTHYGFLLLISSLWSDFTLKEYLLHDNRLSKKLMHRINFNELLKLLIVALIPLTHFFLIPLMFQSNQDVISILKIPATIYLSIAFAYIFYLVGMFIFYRRKEKSIKKIFLEDLEYIMNGSTQKLEDIMILYTFNHEKEEFSRIKRINNILSSTFIYRDWINDESFYKQ